MRALRPAGISLGALLGLGLVGVTVLLIYYRPTIEYAYVDVLDGTEHAVSGWWLVIGAVLVGATAWLVVSRILGRRRQ